MLQIYTEPLGKRHSLIKERRPKLHSWSSLGKRSLGKRRKPRSYQTLTTMKMRLHFNVSNIQKDNICNFSVTVKLKEVLKM